MSLTINVILIPFTIRCYAGSSTRNAFTCTTNLGFPTRFGSGSPRIQMDLLDVRHIEAARRAGAIDPVATVSELWTNSPGALGYTISNLRDWKTDKNRFVERARKLLEGSQRVSKLNAARTPEEVSKARSAEAGT
ncbi:hypothetical protein I317_05118 [Kwoniella heveanensis CBS 569]|nr:hypothetical protein I317_05118 [Kwoniella heveanensis CBS 569]